MSKSVTYDLITIYRLIGIDLLFISEVQVDWTHGQIRSWSIDQFYDHTYNNTFIKTCIDNVNTLTNHQEIQNPIRLLNLGVVSSLLLPILEF